MIFVWRLINVLSHFFDILSSNGWHLRFNQMISKNHPNLFECINTIKREQNLTEAFISQIDGGQSVVRKNKMYEIIDRRIRNLDQRFLDGYINTVEYLKGIAYNLS
uniref:Uncharacterized protein n=1 Tax=Romanomermis culicivorax TaxID=13658 RepID=A0A915I7I5_ROMCU